MGKGEEGE